MTIADLSKIAGRTYPARRRTRNLVGGASPIGSVKRNVVVSPGTLSTSTHPPCASTRPFTM